MKNTHTLIAIVILLLLLIFMIWIGPIVKQKFDFVSTSKEESELANKLSGRWETIGMFKNNQPMYDTIFWQLEDDFDTIESSSYALWADSGKYLHSYLGDSLTDINLLKEVDIIEFDVIYGLVRNYLSVPEVSQNEVGSFDQRMKLIAHRNGAYLRMFNEDGSIDSVFIRSLTDSTLILDYGDGYEERFRRLN